MFGPQRHAFMLPRHFAPSSPPPRLVTPKPLAQEHYRPSSARRALVTQLHIRPRSARRAQEPSRLRRLRRPARASSVNITFDVQTYRERRARSTALSTGGRSLALSSLLGGKNELTGASLHAPPVARALDRRSTPSLPAPTYSPAPSRRRSPLSRPSRDYTSDPRPPSVEDGLERFGRKALATGTTSTAPSRARSKVRRRSLQSAILHRRRKMSYPLRGSTTASFHEPLHQAALSSRKVRHVLSARSDFSQVPRNRPRSVRGRADRCAAAARARAG